MCSGSGAAGNSTTSSGNKGSRLIPAIVPAQPPCGLTATPPGFTSTRMQLNGRIAVVTGGSMGIGEAIATAFADRGASVVVTSRDVARAEAARARIGHAERTLAVACDVRRRADIEGVLRATLERFGRV